jgi:hypothetical protein
MGALIGSQVGMAMAIGGGLGGFAPVSMSVVFLPTLPEPKLNEPGEILAPAQVAGICSYTPNKEARIFVTSRNPRRILMAVFESRLCEP